MGYSPWPMVLVSTSCMASSSCSCVRIRKQSTPSFRLLVHGADIRVASSGHAVRHRSGKPVFPVLCVRARRFRLSLGLAGDLRTSVATVSLLWAESFAVRHGATVFADHVLARYRWRPGRQRLSVRAKRLFMLSAVLLVMGLLLGYLAEQQKRLRSERAIIALILGRARVEAGLTGTLQEILAELLSMYGAPAP